MILFHVCCFGWVHHNVIIIIHIFLWYMFMIIRFLHTHCSCARYIFNPISPMSFVPCRSLSIDYHILIPTWVSGCMLGHDSLSLVICSVEQVLSTRSSLRWSPLCRRSFRWTWTMWRHNWIYYLLMSFVLYYFHKPWIHINK